MVVTVIDILNNKKIIIDDKSRAALLIRGKSKSILPFKQYEIKGERIIKQQTVLGYCIHDKRLIDDCLQCSSLD